jgi:hypothetical protein
MRDIRGLSAGGSEIKGVKPASNILHKRSKSAGSLAEVPDMRLQLAGANSNSMRLPDCARSASALHNVCDG